MQPRPTPTKPKYKLKDYSAPGNYALNKALFLPNDTTCKLYCICNKFDLDRSKKCSRCHESYHCCVTAKSMDVKDWTCLRCQSKFMDPIFWPEEILLETFFRTESVTQYGNVIEFGFYLRGDQLGKIVEVRGLQDGRTGLAWPMHGEYYLNKQQFPEPILDIKPLLKNSNRKYRKQQAFILPQDKLKAGKNILTFSIPKLNQQTYEARYQIQMRGIYFIGIYSIKKLQKQELIQKTFQTSKMDKAASLEFLRKELLGEGELSVEKSVICLECPYMKSRIKIPVRGKNCQHYTCICLDTLIQARGGINSRQWHCPICNSPINQPVIDMFILSILNDGSAGIKVSLDATGHYEWMAFEDDNMSLSSDSPPKNVEPVPKKNSPQKPTVTIVQTPEIPKPKPQTSVSLALAMERLKQKQKQRQMAISTQKQKVSQAPIQIDLQDNPEPVVVVSPPQIPQIPPLQRPKVTARKNTGAQNAKSPFQQLQIMIPESKQKFDKQKLTNATKQKLKQSVSLSVKKSKESEVPVMKPTSKKPEYLITDVKEVEFKNIGFNQFVKKYFQIQYSRNKVSDDLRNIFKEVL